MVFSEQLTFSMTRFSKTRMLLQAGEDCSVEMDAAPGLKVAMHSPLAKTWPGFGGKWGKSVLPISGALARPLGRAPRCVNEALPDGRASAPHREPTGSNTQLPQYRF